MAGSCSSQPTTSPELACSAHPEVTAGTELPVLLATQQAEQVVAAVSALWLPSTTPNGPEPLSPPGVLPGLAVLVLEPLRQVRTAPAGSAGIGLLLALATLDGKTRANVKAFVTPSVLTTLPLLPSPTVCTYDQAPVWFIGGPKETKTYGAPRMSLSGRDMAVAWFRRNI